MRLFLVAGEASGDLHAGNLAAAVLRRAPDAQIIGYGGEHMRRCGVDVRFDLTSLAVVGFFEIIGKVGQLTRAMRDVRAEIASEKPDAVVLVDYPGFNLRLARHVHEMGIPVVYYIAPQVWAWHRSRVKKIARDVDLVLVVFDFEVDFFAENGIEARFVGHPLLDTLDPASVTVAAKAPGGTRRVGILPGSRRVEVSRLLPVMLQAGQMVREKVGDRDGGVELQVSSAFTVDEQLVADLVAKSGVQAEVIRGTGRNVLRRADAVMVASGTATLECCIFGVPMAVLYKVSLPSYLAAKRMINVPYASLVNLIAGEEVVPEFMQVDANSKKVSECVVSLLDPSAADAMKKRLAEVKAKLGQPGASDRAAEEILRLVR